MRRSLAALGCVVVALLAMPGVAGPSSGIAFDASCAFVPAGPNPPPPTTSTYHIVFRVPRQVRQGRTFNVRLAIDFPVPDTVQFGEATVDGGAAVDPLPGF